MLDARANHEPPMSNKSIIHVALIGIPEIEEKRLHAAFEHSKTRNITYKKVALDKDPEILMVNADEPPSLIKWQSFRNKLQGTEPYSVMVSKDREFNTRHYQVRRPLIASRAISILDQVASNVLKIAEELVITSDINQGKKVVSENAKEYSALVVDDSLPVRIQMDQALKPFASRVDFAETGEDAFNLINQNDYDIIFLDVVLPGMDGYEICKTIKDGKAREIPVIMLTGNSSSADKIKGKLAGCDTYLIKPVSSMVFHEVMNQYLPAKATI